MASTSQRTATFACETSVFPRGTLSREAAVLAGRRQGRAELPPKGHAGRRASQAGAAPHGGAGLLGRCREIGSSAAANALFGALASGLQSLRVNGERCRYGELNRGQCAAEVALDVAKGAAGSAATTAGALALKEGGKAAARSLGSAGLKRFAGSNAATALAFGTVEIGISAVSLARGRISRGEFARKAMGTAGGAAGDLGGASGGAAIGTLLLPGVGTAIGAVLGGLAGQMAGGSLLDAAGRGLFG